MAKVKTKYVCQNCSYETPRWLGKCPECLKWNTLEEEIEQKAKELQRQNWSSFVILKICIQYPIL